MKFKAIPKYEGMYEISRNGTLKSLDRLIIHKNGKISKREGIIITHKKPKNENYYQAVLSKNGHSTLYRIHRLVALTWVPNPENKRYVNHIDGDKLNNNANNLEWVTPYENIRHCKDILRKNLNISFTKIVELYKLNKKLDLESFINLIKTKCK